MFTEVCRSNFVLDIVLFLYIYYVFKLYFVFKLFPIVKYVLKMCCYKEELLKRCIIFNNEDSTQGMIPKYYNEKGKSNIINMRQNKE